MKADITFSQLYWNPSLLNFFFRTQSENTMNELLDRATDRKDAIERIDSYGESVCNDLDEFEEMFYEMSVEELAAEIGIEMDEDEDE